MTSREKFEAWVKFHLDDKFTEVPLYRGNGGLNYLDSQVDLAWIAWQAAETDMAVQLANAESKCRDLAAENTAMKECASDVMKHVYRSKSYLDSNRVVDAIQGLQCAIERKAGKTQATDAFLAEVRAQGVEMFGQYHNFSEKLFIQKEAQKFAAQLRKGAAL